ncbi:porin [Oxalobacter formigenes]|uniref:Gram-negative porin n=1 Tax=Oxalobacter formigenes OXCC13 TaxID=556269 RepID=C3XAP3_OXAFO|nr:porin [Oxalobacter formigenes]ARQ45578.1 Outer membrane porin protein [Oxalobacter formigenes]ARQ79195.1 porin [Oxalobacter formigenes OXCC13]EEO30269.1 Gram-negative porin [Oxalobacter formigenes OXCC13]MCZ4062013.1 porin [Oxalobacter formigenes]QDX33625.1 porin [Oxalobacter formigenes]
MKKTLIALAIMGASASAAYAQSHVTIYGVVDTGLVKETGTDLRMGSNVDSRLGFRGVEDLGSNMKATFELERRFNLNDGTQSNPPEFDINNPITNVADLENVDRTNWNYNDFISGKRVDWVGAANVGLKGDAWGQVRLGRVNNLSVETFRMLDPFNQYGVGASLAKANLLRSEQLSNTIRYDSPSWSGFGLGATYTLGQNSKGSTPSALFYDQIGNDGWAVNLKYDNGPILLLANYDRAADSNDSYTWNVGGAYNYAGFKVSLGYQDSRLKLFEAAGTGAFKEKDWIVGLQYKTGPHTIGASYNRGKVEVAGTNFDGSTNKYALGYTYNMSKRTSVYANVAYTDNDEEIAGWYNLNGSNRDSVTGVQLGITHKF